MNSSVITVVLGLAIFLSCMPLTQISASENDDAAPALLYRFKVGHELVYDSTSEFKHTNGVLGSTGRWNIWIIRRNDDGSWRLILRRSSSRYRIDSKGKRSESPASSTLAYCDLFPDGRIPQNSSLGYRFDPSALFIHLPVGRSVRQGGPNDTQSDKEGWSYRDAETNVTYRSKLRTQTDDESKLRAIEIVRESPMDAIYLATSKSVAYFDTVRGLVDHVDSENTQGYGFKGKGTGSAKLKTIKTHDAAWAKKFAREASRYFNASAQYQELTGEASLKPSECADLLSKAEKALKLVREALTIPMLQEQLDEQIGGHAQRARYLTERAERRAKLIGQPAADWETTDFIGKAHSLKQYRGKVVILDFWYRGCGWCIRAMPQLNQIAQHFKDKPVAVLGMNTDRKEEDARFVVAKMGLTYPNLRATGIPEKYQVRGFPTLIIIDQQGIVHDIHVGYSRDLREEVVKSVESILRKK